MSNKIIDISGLNRFLENVKTYINNSSASKQDVLVSGDNIKTVNGESLLGTGNIVIENNVASTPDWNSKFGEAGYIKNRTHYIDLDRGYQLSINNSGTIIEKDNNGNYTSIKIQLFDAIASPVQFLRLYNNGYSSNWEHIVMHDDTVTYFSWAHATIERVDDLTAYIKFYNFVDDNNTIEQELLLIYEDYDGMVNQLPDMYIPNTIARKTDLNNKVDKVEGKQLTTEDFTTALKTKLIELNNYDDTEINNAVANLQTQLNTLVNGNANDAINSFNEIIAFLDGIKDTEDLESIIASIEQQIAGKQDVINDLASIRSGAALGATALQSYTEKYTGTITGIKMNGTVKGTSGEVDLGTVITSHQDISGKADKSSLATVATSGSYNDLTNKPNIPVIESIPTTDIESLTYKTTK